MDATNSRRRAFVKKAAYITPAVVSFAVAPSYAKAGSQKPEKEPQDPKEPKPPKTK